jgi:hypothetical protein
MEYFNEPEFQDPADWDIASYTAHPIDSIEPLPDHSTSYRDAALECMKILRSVDVFMSRATDPRLAWTTVSHTIGLASTHGLRYLGGMSFVTIVGGSQTFLFRDIFPMV